MNKNFVLLTCAILIVLVSTIVSIDKNVPGESGDYSGTLPYTGKAKNNVDLLFGTTINNVQESKCIESTGDYGPIMGCVVILPNGDLIVVFSSTESYYAFDEYMQWVDF